MYVQAKPFACIALQIIASQYLPVLLQYENNKASRIKFREAFIIIASVVRLLVSFKTQADIAHECRVLFPK